MPESSQNPDAEKSIKEKRIRAMTSLYYSKPDVQKAIFEFSKKRETVPRYFEGFGKRPDSLEYPGDVFELVKKGATSFHCSEEIWKDPLQIQTGMSSEKLNELREGWDLLIDIDSKYIDYSKIMAQVIIKMLKFHGVKNVGIKFSGSKGFHMIIPWNSFPENVGEIPTSSMFPEWPRIITQYIMKVVEKDLIDKVSNLTKPSRYIKDFEAPKEVMPDLILVSPRHLFRAPYSLHEKTSLSSIVISADQLETFDLKDADPMKIKIRNFYPDSKKGEASELLMQALDWNKSVAKPEKKTSNPVVFAPIKIEKLSDSHLPPSVQQILKGVDDGRKRGLFVLLNLFRSIGMDKEELEKRIEEWNKKNKVPLRQGYIQAQLDWSYKNKPILPPNFDKDYYKALGITPTPEEMRYKNPVTYVVKKNSENSKPIKPSKSPKTKDNFKNNN